MILQIANTVCILDEKGLVMDFETAINKFNEKEKEIRDRERSRRKG